MFYLSLKDLLSDILVVPTGFGLQWGISTGVGIGQNIFFVALVLLDLTVYFGWM